MQGSKRLKVQLSINLQQNTINSTVKNSNKIKQIVQNY